MIIVEPSAELMSVTKSPALLIEAAGRTCYKSEDRICEGSADKLINGTLRKLGHLSVLEHAVATFRFVCDRGVTHEMVRHRLASFSQESTRYCNYGKNKFGGQIRVIKPPCKTDIGAQAWEEAMLDAERHYLRMLDAGEPPQIARSVLPNSLKTEIVMTANFREWLHVFALRTKPAAHPQIVEVMLIAQEILKKECPEVFDTEV